MHPSSSKFYQKIVFPPFHLIFSGLAPCFCFLKWFQAVKFLNEICFKGNADESTLDFLKQLHGKNIFLFGTAGFGGSEEYFNKILKKVERSLDRSNTVFGRYMCQGKMPLSVRQRYEGMKKQPIHLPNLDALIENFDNALSHPDAEDLERLKQAVK